MNKTVNKNVIFILFICLLIFIAAGCDSYETKFYLKSINQADKIVTYDVLVWYEPGLGYRDIIYSGWGYKVPFDSVDIWKREKIIDCEKVIEFHKKHK